MKISAFIDLIHCFSFHSKYFPLINHIGPVCLYARSVFAYILRENFPSERERDKKKNVWCGLVYQTPYVYGMMKTFRENESVYLFHMCVNIFGKYVKCPRFSHLTQFSMSPLQCSSTDVSEKRCCWRKRRKSYFSTHRICMFIIEKIVFIIL